MLRFRRVPALRPPTVSRVSKALNGEYGGYRKILIKLEDGE